jgi:hypothetical protein
MGFSGFAREEWRWGLTERGAAAFWRRDGDGGTAKRGMGILVKGREGTVSGEREISFLQGLGLIRCFYF